MGKGKPKPQKKEMSEGKAIAITVLLVTLAVIAAGYILQWIISYFFPRLF